MRSFAFVAPFAVVAAVASAAQAQSAEVTVSIGPGLQAQADELGRRDVDQQAAELQRIVEQALSRAAALEGAQIRLVLTDLRPNRPTMEQLARRPGLSAIDSISLGGAAIEGEIVTADGVSRPVRYERYSSNLSDVRGFTTWQDARLAFDGLARSLVEGQD